MRAWIILIVLTIVMPVACLMGPDYERPELPVKDKWAHGPDHDSTPEQIIRIDWWSNFKDPYLNDLISEALIENYDLKILLARIDQAGAAISSSRADQLPTADLSAGTNYSKSVGEESSTPIDTESYRVGVGISWELDIWGKNRRSYLASEASYQASQADYRAGYLKLVADIATSYFQIRAIDEKLAVLERFYHDSLQRLVIYRNQFKEGLVPDWKVNRQDADVKGLQQGLLELERIREINANRLATLLGKPAGELSVPKINLQDRIQPVEVPMGLPADLLSRRPDIVAAEYNLLAATHQIGVATAARLPSISLTGNFGLASTALSSMLNQWSLGIAPSIIAPLFDGGRRKADLQASEAKVQIAQNEYLKTVMTAFEEVENSLVNLNSRASQQRVLEEKVDSLEKVRAQTLAKFAEGLISQLEVLDVENERLSATNALLETHRLLLNDTVTLYKSLGGGWPLEIVQ